MNKNRSEKSALQDTYDTIHSCSAATKIPVGLIRLAKKNGCPGFQHSRVQLLPLLHWIFSQKDSDDKVDWTAEVRKWQAKREKLKHEREADHLVERSQVVETIHRILPRIAQVLEAKLLNEWPSAVAGLDPAQARVYGKRLLDQTFAIFRDFENEWQEPQWQEPVVARGAVGLAVSIPVAGPAPDLGMGGGQPDPEAAVHAHGTV